jgi:hypothetical protein
MAEGEVMEIKIKRKIVHGKSIRVLACKDKVALIDFVRSHYIKQKGWFVSESIHLSGFLFKKYKIVLKKGIK